MKRNLFLITLLLLGGSIFPESSVYKVSRGSSICYLGGTIHILKESSYPLPVEYDFAYDNSATLIIEADIGKLSEPKYVQMMMREGTYDKGESIKDYLSRKTYKQLEEILGGYSLSLEDMGMYKPAMISSILSSIQMQSAGFTQEGVDSHFYNRAVEEAKEIRFLETVEFQIERFSNLGIGYEEEFIASELKDFNKSLQVLEEMEKEWSKGERIIISRVTKEMQDEFPHMYRTLLKERNDEWIGMIDGYLDDENVEFILFGAMHLYGEDGLINLLEREGCTVEQLDRS